MYSLVTAVGISYGYIAPGINALKSLGLTMLGNVH